LILTLGHRELADLDEKKIADIMGVNPAVLSREFKTDQDMTLNEFIQRERVYRAFFMIEKNHETSIKALCVKLGFTAIPNFCREFKRVLFIDPYRYIKLKKEKE
jgi:AraC-like DNA-binding protein